MKNIFNVFGTLGLAGFITAAEASDVFIPDPGLNAVVREALQKPTGPLSEQDMLNLTHLEAQNRNISSAVGLEAAFNLSSLLLHSNHLTEFVLTNALTNLVVLDLSANSLTNLSLPSGMTNLFSMVMAGNPLTHLILPSDLNQLVELDLDGNQLTSLNLSSNLTGLSVLSLGFNSLTDFSLPGGLTNLDTLILRGNSLTNVTLPEGLTRLTNLSLDENHLGSFTLPAGFANLHALGLFFNQLTNVTLPTDLRSLFGLDLDNNRLTSLNLPSNLTRLGFLHLRSNQLTNFNLPPDMKALSYLDLGENQLSSIYLPTGLGYLTTLRISGNTNLTSLTLPGGMTNLSGIFLRSNSLTNLQLPPDLYQLASLDALGNQLTSLDLPMGLTNLTELFLAGNQLTHLTLPPDMAQLKWLVLGEPDNPLTNFVLSESLAANTNLAGVVASLRTQGVPVFTYPLKVQLAPRPEQPIGAFRFAITGPPGDYTVFSSTNLTDWNVSGAAANPLGSVVFTDVTAQFSPQKFYHAARQSPPANMVFIAPNTFTMGSPVSEVGHQPDESPQTTVTLSHGFWMAKFLVTQSDYLTVTGENPSGFPGDLQRPVESVSWFAASNYCAQLTAQHLAARRIPPGSHYRLPTEAEWECAARAGTSTRFYYGDDPDLSGLASYAWYGARDGVTTHPVGQKGPNAWGLFDMAGNVWEWCQDWYGTYPGGSMTDPQGPDSNSIGWKVIRGGAWEASESDCRSASRWFEPASPFISDFIIGFRVVLVTEPNGKAITP